MDVPLAPSAGGFVLVVLPSAKARVEWEVMLARLRWEARALELLAAAPWCRALGYRVDELHGRPLYELLPADGPAPGEVIAAMTRTDEEDDRPLELTLRCKDGRRKAFRLHRYHDRYEGEIYVLAEELP